MLSIMIVQFFREEFADERTQRTYLVNNQCWVFPSYRITIEIEKYKRRGLFAVFCLK